MIDVKPDLGFIKEVINSGGESLKKCYQCATCSVVCNLAPDDSPFPRKEMIRAQWGMKDKLVSDPDIWLCHQCSDCTAYCPRGAKPGEIIGAIRKSAIAHYAFPGFLGKAVGQIKYLPLLIVGPVILFLAVLSLPGNMNLVEGEIVFSNLVQVKYIDAIFMPTAAFAALAFLIGISRFWRDMIANSKQPNPPTSLFASLISAVTEILTHRRFKKCEVNQSRSTAHLLVFYSFIGLAITTALALFYLYILGKPSPYSLISPLKIIGNISALTLIMGIVLVMVNRLNNKDKAGPGTYFDWLFIGVVSVVAVSGILAELTRLAGLAILAYPIYFIHLVSVFFLFFYAPYSKLAHMLYRTTAMVYSKATQREE
ncbi:MAG: quinone-interacting membrane-bound oxidoreductase complex subunit QmoC [bacterium]